MCDTQVLIVDGAVWFAKNSDREPSEPQSVVRYAAVSGDPAPRLRVSHIEIDQVPERRATILSQPAWCWGAEMGLNDASVAIGNEAIFSKRATLQPGLLGMDLVRLGLERAGSAAEAVRVMATLLERHGQGGPAGYGDRGFCYDNSYLVADPREAWVLETAGRDWAARRVQQRGAISNALTLGRDYDLASAAVTSAQLDFAASFDTRLMPAFARARSRRTCALRGLDQSRLPAFSRMAAQLRTHARGNEDPAAGSNADVCMHAAGFIRRHQTTGSMIARLAPDGTDALFTGTSAPCLSIFRPVRFDGDWTVLTPEAGRIDAPLWRRHEWLHRWALADAGLRERLRSTRDVIEPQIFALMALGDAQGAHRADRLAASWHKVLWESLAGLRPPRLRRHWRRIVASDGIDPGRR
jgi:secernin